MAYDRVTARPAIVAAARSMIGRYPYQAGGGHLWTPGQPVPRSFDCSGFTFYEFLSTLNIDLRVDKETTSEIQWGFALGGEVHGVNLVLPGMLVYFIDFTYPDPGHVGIVSQVNKSGVNTYVSAYDTALGIVEEPWTWGAGTFYGVTDPISTLPLPTPYEEDPMFIVQHPVNSGMCLVNGDKWAGIPNPTALAALQTQGIKILVMPKDQFQALVSVPWGQV